MTTVMILSAMILYQGHWIQGHKQFSQLEPRVYKTASECRKNKRKHLRTFKENKADIKKYYNVTKIRLTCKRKRVIVGT